VSAAIVPPSATLGMGPAIVEFVESSTTVNAVTRRSGESRQRVRARLRSCIHVI